MGELGPELEPLEVVPRRLAAPKPPRHVPRRVALGVVGVVFLSAVAAVVLNRGGPESAPVEEAAGSSWTRAPEGDEPAPAGWRRGAPGPLRSRQGHVAVWTGEEIIAWDYELHAAGFDPTLGPRARWYGHPDLPLDFAECYPRGIPAGDAVFAEHCGQGAVYRPGMGG